MYIADFFKDVLENQAENDNLKTNFFHWQKMPKRKNLFAR